MAHPLSYGRSDGAQVTALRSREALTASENQALYNEMARACGVSCVVWRVPGGLRPRRCRRGADGAAGAQAARQGRLREVFGCGTACMVQPVERLARASGEAFDAPFHADDPTTLTARLTRALSDIQYGRVEHEWSVPFE